MNQEISNQRNSALLVIDVQKGLFERSSPIYKADELLININTLVDQAHTANIPVFYIQHANKDSLVKGSSAWQFHPNIQPQAKDSIVHKQHGNAFEGTQLDANLKAQGITNLVITGLITYACVKASCLGALALEYKVFLVSDAHSNSSKQAQKIIEGLNNKMILKGAVLIQTSEVVFR